MVAAAGGVGACAGGCRGAAGVPFGVVGGGVGVCRPFAAAAAAAEGRPGLAGTFAGAGSRPFRMNSLNNPSSLSRTCCSVGLCMCLLQCFINAQSSSWMQPLLMR